MKENIHISAKLIRTHVLYFGVDCNFRYQALYNTHATKVGEAGSLMSPKLKSVVTTGCVQKDRRPSNRVTNQHVEHETDQPDDHLTDQSRLAPSVRDLPYWMVKKHSSSSKLSLDRSDSETSLTSCKIK